MSAWLLPLAAAALWSGLLARPTVAGPLPAWAALLIGFAALACGWFFAPRVRVGPDALESAGLAPSPPAAVAAVSAARGVGRRASPVALAAFLVAGMFMLGSGWGEFRHDGVRAGMLARMAPAHVEVVGSLRTDPKAGQFGWSALLGVSRVSSSAGATGATGAASLRESVWLQGDGSPPSVRRGDVIAASGMLLEPSDPGFASYLESRGVAVELIADEFRRVGPSGNPLVRFAGVARLALGRSFQRMFGPKESGLLMGLALGDTSGLDDGMARDFKATGLGHLLAVSGENVAMVLAPVMGLAMMLRLGPVAKFALGLGTVAFFVILTGGEPSVLRAGVMAGIALTGVLLGRPRSSWAVMGAAVVILLLLDPFLVSSVGFQLSVAATVGMVAMAGPLAARMSFLPKPLAMALGTSMAAQIGVAPLLLSYFHWIPGVTLMANLAAFPAVGPALVLGLAAAAAGLVFSPLGWVLAQAALVFLRYLEILADRMATAPIGSITSGGGLRPLVGGAVVLLVTALWVRRGWRPPRVVLVAVFALMPMLVWSTALRAGPPSLLTIHFFDVEQGDGALITSPGGAQVLVDGGPDPELIATDLAALGVKRIDAVVATHQHADHIVGLPQVLARFPVGVVLEPGCADPSPSYADLLDAIADEGVPVRNPRAGDVIQVGDLTLDVLAPSGCYLNSHSDPNNDSIVFRLEYLEDTVLFAADAEVESQQAMLDAGAPVASEVLKVPHHGGDTSWPEFFDAVHAQVAVVSVGQPNDYGHPVPSVLDTIAATGAQIFRTDEGGDLTVTFSPEGVAVESATA